MPQSVTLPPLLASSSVENSYLLYVAGYTSYNHQCGNYACVWYNYFFRSLVGKCHLKLSIVDY